MSAEEAEGEKQQSSSQKGPEVGVGPDEAGPGEAGRGERAELGMGVPPGTGPGRKRLSLVDGMDLGESSFLCPSALVSLKEMCFRHFPLPALTPGQK